MDRGVLDMALTDLFLSIRGQLMLASVLNYNETLAVVFFVKLVSKPKKGIKLSNG